MTYLSNKNGQIEVYAVPTEYSSDGYYVAVWDDTEMEPVPACAAASTTLLLHLRVEQDQDTLITKPISHVKEITYA